MFNVLRRGYPTCKRFDARIFHAKADKSLNAIVDRLESAMEHMPANNVDVMYAVLSQYFLITRAVSWL